MSQRVLPLVAINPDTVKTIRTLHFVPDGQMHCAVCGKHKLAMGFHYTNDEQFWAHSQTYIGEDPVLGMWSPSDEAAMPYSLCGDPPIAGVIRPEGSDAVIIVVVDDGNTTRH